MKNLGVFLVVMNVLCGSAFANETAWTRRISCMAPGSDGANANGTYTIFSRTNPEGSLEVSRSVVNLKTLRFQINGKSGSTIRNIVASTTKNGDGNDRWFSDFENTNTPRIKRISLTLTQENEDQAESFIITAKGNTYKMSCSINGSSG